MTPDPVTIILAIMTSLLYPLMLNLNSSISKLKEEVGEIKGKLEMIIKYMNGRKPI